MKLFLTIILGLLLLQSVTGLHLHAEEEGSGNVTTTDNSTDIDNVTQDDASNETDIGGDIFDSDANVTSDDDIDLDNQTESILEKTQRNYKFLKYSGDEDIAAAAKEAKAAFKDVVAEIQERVDAAGNLSEDATDQEIDAANATLASAKDEFEKAYGDFNDKLEELKKQLEEKQAASASQ